MTDQTATRVLIVTAAVVLVVAALSFVFIDSRQGWIGLLISGCLFVAAAASLRHQRAEQKRN